MASKKDAEWYRKYRAKKKQQSLLDQEAVGRPLFLTAETNNYLTQASQAVWAEDLVTTEQKQAEKIMGDLIAFPNKPELAPSPLKEQPSQVLAHEVQPSATPVQPEITPLATATTDATEDATIGCNATALPQAIKLEIQKELAKFSLELSCYKAELAGLQAMQPPVQPQLSAPLAATVIQPEVQPPTIVVQPSATPTQPTVQPQPEVALPIAGLNPHTLALCVGISVFLAANTIFLAREQVTLYQAYGYSLTWAIVLSALTESALMGFSALASATKEWHRKLPLYVMSIAFGAIILGLLGESVNHRAHQNTAQSDAIKSQKAEIAVLEAMREGISKDMEQLDSGTHPTQRAKLRANLTDLNAQIARAKDMVATQLTTAPTELSGATATFRYQRWAMMLASFVLAGYLGKLLNRRK